MSKGHLLRSQTNAVLELIQAAELQPSDFSWREETSGRTGKAVPVLEHTPTGYYFKFEIHPSNRDHACEFSPGEDIRVSFQYPGSWEGLLNYLSLWLLNLKREIEAPDLWSAVSKERALVEAANRDDSNRSFSPQELQQIKEKLLELQEYILSTHELTEEQSRFVRSRLKYLTEAAERQGYTDWIHTAIGVLFSFAITLAFSSADARDLFRVAARLLSFIFEGSIKLIQ